MALITDAKLVQSNTGRRWFYRCQCGRRANKGPMVQHLTGKKHNLNLKEAYDAIEESIDRRDP